MRIALAVIALAACKTSSPTGTTTPEPAKTVAKFPRGATTPFGCFAHSESTKSFACVTGSRSLGIDPTLELRYLGSPATADELAEQPLPEARITELDATLARDFYWALDGASTPLTAQPLALAGTTITWKRNQTSPGGDNMAPTFDDSVTCGTTAIFESKEGEGIDYKLAVRTVGTLGLLEVTSHVGREGESTDAFEAVVFDTATCAILGR